MIRKINCKEYSKLVEKRKEELDVEKWVFRDNAQAHPIINELFEENRILERLVLPEYGESFTNHYENMKIPHGYPFFDHDYYVNSSEKLEEKYDINFAGINFTGIILLPYIRFGDIETVMEVLGEFWDLYIINPLLLRYGSAIGVFLTPKLIPDPRHWNPDYVDENPYLSDFNNIVLGKTGYDFFYKYSNEEEIEPITKYEWKPSFEHFKKFWGGGDYPVLFEKLINFWHDNEEIKCDDFDTGYDRYCNNLGFTCSDTVDLIRLESSVPFEFVNTKTGWSTGPINAFEFDFAFDCAYTNSGGGIKITDEMYKDLNNNYEWRLVKE